MLTRGGSLTGVGSVSARSGKLGSPGGSEGGKWKGTPLGRPSTENSGEGDEKRLRWTEDVGVCECVFVCV